MGLLFMEVLPLDAGKTVLKCRRCRADTAYEEEIQPGNFQGLYGKAYLFDRVVNLNVGPKEDRNFITGLHTVNDLYCNRCQEVLGWRYERAYEERERNTRKGSSSLREPWLGKKCKNKCKKCTSEGPRAVRHG